MTYYALQLYRGHGIWRVDVDGCIKFCGRDANYPAGPSNEALCANSEAELHEMIDEKLECWGLRDEP